MNISTGKEKKLRKTIIQGSWTPFSSVLFVLIKTRFLLVFVLFLCLFSNSATSQDQISAVVIAIKKVDSQLHINQGKVGNRIIVSGKKVKTSGDIETVESKSTEIRVSIYEDGYPPPYVMSNNRSPGTPLNIAGGESRHFLTSVIM